jgi:DNA-binding response OmpR family regulator
MMRVKEQASSLPVLMITGTSTENPEVFLENGAQAYLLKPVSKTDLEATLFRLLQA